MSLQSLPLVTLLTDFGQRDHFVASMKGVILGISPHVNLVDVSHQVTAHKIEEAAYLLKSSYRYFPEGTIHVVVVDPGVGTARRALLATSSRYFFLAPDNGVLSYALEDESGVEVRQIENKQYRLDAEGATFEGRDLFAPCAAWLTRGQQPGSYGRLIQDYVRLPRQKPDLKTGVLHGRVLYIDRFGNVITNITPYELREWRGVTKRSDGEAVVSIGGRDIHGLLTTYAEGDGHAPGALINSHGQLELFVKEGRACDVLHVGIGDAVDVR
ncbi:MAG: SAM-dependent chlorinase/fluorinase [Nitrospiraceae bacterium]